MISPQSSQQAPMESQYSILINNTVCGPYTMQQLKEMVKTGQIGIDTLIYTSGMPDWVRYSDLLDKMTEPDTTEQVSTNPTMDSHTPSPSDSIASDCSKSGKIIKFMQELLTEIKAFWVDKDKFKQFFIKLSHCSLFSTNGCVTRSNVFWIFILIFIPTIIFFIYADQGEFPSGNHFRGMGGKYPKATALLLHLGQGYAITLGCWYAALLCIYVAWKIIDFAIRGKAPTYCLNPIKWIFKPDVRPILMPATIRLFRIIIQFVLFYLIHIALFALLWHYARDAYYYEKISSHRVWYYIKMGKVAYILIIPIFAFLIVSVITRIKDCNMSARFKRIADADKYLFVIIYLSLWLWPIVMNFIRMPILFIIPSITVCAFIEFGAWIWILYKIVSICFRPTQIESEEKEKSHNS